MGIRFERAVDIQEKWILHVGDDDAENPALSAGERARVQIRVVVQLLGGLQYARACGGFDDLEIIEDAGDRGCRNTGFLGHGIQIHCQRTPLAHKKLLNMWESSFYRNWLPAGMELQKSRVQFRLSIIPLHYAKSRSDKKGAGARRA